MNKLKLLLLTGLMILITTPVFARWKDANVDYIGLWDKTYIAGVPMAGAGRLYVQGKDIFFIDEDGTASSMIAGAGAPEGTAVLSTGETVGWVLQADGDNTSSWVELVGGGNAQTANPLSQFAATTSAQLAGVISDETGTNTAVFSDDATLVRPVLGTIASGVGTALTALNGENIQDDTIDDDSIDFADVTGADLTLTDSGAITASGLITGNASLTISNGATSSGVLTILEDTDAGTNFASFQVPALAANTVYTLPSNDGDASQVLSTNGAGVLSWAADAGGAETNSLETTITGIADTEIFIGNGANSGTFAALTGDVFLSSAGLTTIQNNSVDGTDIALGSDAQGDIMQYNGTDYVRTAIGTKGQQLTVNEAGTDLAYGLASKYLSCRKGSVGTINVGEPVYISGYHAGSSSFEVELADSDSAATMPAIGIAFESITNSANTRVLMSGLCSILDTSPTGETWVAGQAIYVSSAALAGGITNLSNVKPTGALSIQRIGTVARVHGTLGAMLVQGAGRTNDVPNIADGSFWVGNASGVATAVAMSGDVTMDNLGAVTVADDSHNHVIANIDSMTSAALAGQISDEEGSGGGFVRATSPTLTTPVLGVATATTINKVTLTPPATSATITATDGTTTTLSGGTHSGTNTGDEAAASTTVAGVIEIATTAEIDAGTGDLAVTVANLESSDYAPRIYSIAINSSTALTAGDGKAFFRLPAELDGWVLTDANAACAVSTGTQTYDIYNVTDGTDTLTTAITIEAANIDSINSPTQRVINTATDDVDSNDRWRIDVTSVVGSDTTFAEVQMVFNRLP